MRASGIRRNAESKRERYVTHDEYREVFAQAPLQVQSMMELTYRTLQRPESDMLDWTVANLTMKDGKRILRVKQAKVRGTGRVVDIELSSDLDALLRKLVGEIPRIGKPLICGSRGEFVGQRYTYDGISSMLKRAITKANKERIKKGITEKIPSFGFRDLKGKGATDMWLSGVPIEEIQLLCGHEDKSTTETYVKQRWRETAAPNMVRIAV
jgi:integrase